MIIVNGNKNDDKNDNDNDNDNNDNNNDNDNKNNFQDIEYQQLILYDEYNKLLQSVKTDSQLQIAIEIIKQLGDIKKTQLEKQFILLHQREKNQKIFEIFELYVVPTILSGIICYAVNSCINLFVKPTASTLSTLFGFVDIIINIFTVSNVKTTYGNNTKEIVEKTGLASALLISVLSWLFIFTSIIILYKIRKSNITLPFFSFGVTSRRQITNQ